METLSEFLKEYRERGKFNRWSNWGLGRGFKEEDYWWFKSGDGNEDS